MAEKLLKLCFPNYIAQVCTCVEGILFLTFAIDVEEVTAADSLCACFDPVKANRLALSDFASTTLSLLMDLREDEAAIVAFFSLVLLDEYCIVEDILRSSDLEAVISDLAAASMVMAEEALPAVLALCLHR